MLARRFNRNERNLSWLFILMAVGSVVLLIFAGFLMVNLLTQSKPVEILFSTGSKKGTYSVIGEGLSSVVNDNLRNVKITVVESSGSLENINRLAEGKVELGFAQGNIQSYSNNDDSIRTLALLYEEILHIVVSNRLKSKISKIADLEGMRVSIGLKGSGTERVARDVLTFMGVDPKEVELVQDISPLKISTEMEAGRIDVAFLVDAYGSPLVNGLLQSKVASLISLGSSNLAGGEANAIAEVFPYYTAKTIYTGSYAGAKEPESSIRTISVQALLLGSSALSESLVEDMLEILYQKKVQIGNEPGARLAVNFSERFNPYKTIYPYHSGAVRYYTRNKPSFLVENAEFFSFVLTMMAMLFTAAISFRTFILGMKKNKVDKLLGQLNWSYERYNSGEIRSEELLDEIKLIERLALEEFKDEKLDIQSFRVYQNYALVIEQRVVESKNNALDKC